MLTVDVVRHCLRCTLRGGQAVVVGRASYRARFASERSQEQSKTSQQGNEIEFEILAGHSVHLL